MIVNAARQGCSPNFKVVKAGCGTFRGQRVAKSGFLRLAAPTATTPTSTTPTGKRDSSWLLFRLFSALIVIALIGVGVSGCRIKRNAPESRGGLLDRPYDENIEVPSGDPDFPHLGEHWVVDPNGLIGTSTVRMADETLDDLKSQRIAEVAIVVQKGVKHPVEWSTHYGRWLRLGEAEGPHQNNGIVFLIIPDAHSEQGKVWYSIGRGLPKLTSSDMGPLLEEAASYANADDLGGAVISIARNIHDILHKIYGRGEK